MIKHVVSTSLVVLYALLGAWVLVQLVFMFREKHKRTGYKAWFNYLTLLFAMMRSIFWLMFALEVPLPDIVFYLWFWLPQSVQFLTFSLLAMFLVKLLAKDMYYEGGWKAKSMAALGAVALAHIVGSAIIATLASEDAVRSGLYSNIQSLGSACVFFVLSFVLGLEGHLLRRTSSWETSRLMLFRFTPKLIAWITFTISAVFISRSIFNFLSFAGVLAIDIDQDDVRTDVSAAAVYAIWEFFPVILLLATLASGPQGTRYAGGAGSTTGGQLSGLPTFGAFGALATLEDEKDGSASAGLLSSQAEGAATLGSPMLGGEVPGSSTSLNGLGGLTGMKPSGSGSTTGAVGPNVGLGLSGISGSSRDLMRDSGQPGSAVKAGRGLGASGGLLATPLTGAGRAGPGSSGLGRGLSGYSLLGAAVQGVASRAGDGLRGWPMAGSHSAIDMSTGAPHGIAEGEEDGEVDPDLSPVSYSGPGYYGQGQGQGQGQGMVVDAYGRPLQGSGMGWGIQMGAYGQGQAQAQGVAAGYGFRSGAGEYAGASGLGSSDGLDSSSGGLQYEDEVGRDIRQAAAVAMSGISGFFKTPTKAKQALPKSPEGGGSGWSGYSAPFSAQTGVTGTSEYTPGVPQPAYWEDSTKSAVRPKGAMPALPGSAQGSQAPSSQRR